MKEHSLCYTGKAKSLLKYASINSVRKVKYEAMLIEELMKHKLRFEYQAVLYKYIADFIFQDKLLVVEVYEKHHDKQKFYDGIRQKNIEGWGFRFISLSYKDIESNINSCIDKILKFESSDENAVETKRKMEYLNGVKLSKKRLIPRNIKIFSCDVYRKKYNRFSSYFPK